MLQLNNETRTARNMRASTRSNQAPNGIGKVCIPHVRMLEIEFSPEDAQRIVASKVHPNQRAISMPRAREYLRAMQDGQWQEPPFVFDVIAFDRNGLLVNGLTRMKALSMHDKPVRFLVMFETQTPVGHKLPEGDGNRPRSGFFIEGINKDEWAVANYLTEIVEGAKRAPRHVVTRVREEILPAMRSIPPAHQRGITAPIHAAFVLRWMSLTTDDERNALAVQWQAFLNLDFDVAWPSIKAVYKSLQSSGVPKGRDARNLQFDRVMYAVLNPSATRIKPDRTVGAALCMDVLGNAICHKEVTAE